MRLTMIILLVVVSALLTLACPPDDDDDNDNDDATPSDDDSGDDDSVDDDDDTIDDDTIDDDTDDDDTADDDTGDDDDDTGDDDDDTADDDTGDDDDDTAGLTAAEPSWTFEYIDETYFPTDIGFLREDDGTLHVTYPALRGELIPLYGTNILRYAVKHPGDDDWEIATIDEREQDLQSPCLVQDGDGGLHILYLLEQYGYVGRTLEHAYKPAGGEWTRQTIEADDFHYDLSCGVQNGEVRVAFSSLADFTISYLKYAVFRDDQWSIETVFDSTTDRFYSPALAFTHDGRPLISYDYDDKLLLAEQTARGWSTVELDQYPAYSSLAVDADDHLHLAYQKLNAQGGNGDLMYQTNRSGSWIATKLDEGYPSSSNTGGRPNLLLDTYRGLHIFYANYTEQDIHYQRRLFGEWDFFPVVVAGISDFSPKATIDDQAGIHLVYGEDQGIYYGFCPGCALHPGTPPDDDDTTDDDTSDDDLAADDDLIDDAEYNYLAAGKLSEPNQALAVTADGTVHWAQTKGNALSLLSQAPGETEWRTRPVDLFAAGPAIAVDGDDRLHLAYHDIRGDTLKVAVENGDDWTIETVAGALHPADRVQLAVDVAGHVHLAYFDLTDETQPILSYAVDTEDGWVVEPVNATSGTFGLALMPDGSPCLAFLSPSRQVLFARRAVDGWTVATVEANTLNNAVSLGVDGGGTAHVVYLRNYIVYYADNAGGVWTSSPVNEDDEADRPMLAVDAAGHVLIAYNKIIYVPSVWLADLNIFHNLNGDWEIADLGQIGTANEGYLSPVIAPSQAMFIGVNMDDSNRCFTNVSGVWELRNIDDRVIVRGLDLLVDDAGVDHLIFTTDSQELRYGALVDGEWTEEPVSGDAEEIPSLAMDDAGTLHAAFVADGGQRLMYADNESGAWNEETVYEAPQHYHTYKLDLAIDGDGRPVIAFQLVASLIGDIMVARRTGDEWTVEAVDTHGMQGYFLSLVVDAQGSLHLAYFDGLGDDLRYATDLSGQWETYTVYWRGRVGWGCDLALDENGEASIVYVDDTFADDVRLSLAQGNEDDWTIVGLDDAAVNQSDSGVRLALDGDDAAHLLYQPSSGDGLKYASNRGGQWRGGIVDDFADAGLYQSIALDDDGYAHVAYYVNGALWLARLPYALPNGE